MSVVLLVQFSKCLMMVSLSMSFEFNLKFYK